MIEAAPGNRQIVSTGSICTGSAAQEKVTQVSVSLQTGGHGPIGTTCTNTCTLSPTPRPWKDTEVAVEEEGVWPLITSTCGAPATGGHCISMELPVMMLQKGCGAAGGSSMSKIPGVALWQPGTPAA